MNWFSPFLSEPCGVLLVTASRAALLRRGRLRWQPPLYFAADDTDSGFSALLTRWPSDIKLYIVLDGSGESFHSEKVALMGSHDRRALLKHIQQKVFADAAMVCSKVQADTVSMSALDSSDILWLKLLQIAAVPPAGIYTTTVLLQQLAHCRGWLRRWPHLLLFSLHTLSGLHQTGFRDGNIIFARRTPWIDDGVSETDKISSEIVRVVTYWRAQITDDRAKMLVLYVPDQQYKIIREALADIVADQEISHCSFNTDSRILYPACDLMLAQDLACGLSRASAYPPSAQFATASRISRLRSPGTRLALAAMIIAAAILVFMRPHTNALLAASGRYQLAVRHDKAAVANLPAHDNSETLQQRVQAAARLIARVPVPTPMLHWLRQAGVLDSAGQQDGPRLDHIDWQLAGAAEHARVVLAMPESTVMAAALDTLDNVLQQLRGSVPAGYIAAVENEPLTLRNDSSTSKLVLQLVLQPQSDS